jgi:phage terminase small subunit
LHLVEGTYVKRLHRNRRKSVSVGGKPLKPAFLPVRAAEIWDEHVPAMSAAGLLSRVDGRMFAVFCVLAAEFEADPAGMSAARITQMRLIAGSFGMDPTGRLRLPALSDDRTQDPATKFLT